MVEPVTPLATVDWIIVDADGRVRATRSPEDDTRCVIEKIVRECTTSLP